MALTSGLPPTRTVATLTPISVTAHAITDEASPFALRSTRIVREQQCTGGAQSHVVKSCRDDGVGVSAINDHARPLARDLPETALHATSRRHTTQPSTAPFYGSCD